VTRILVVEDDGAVARAVKRLLVTAGFEVDTAEDPVVARSKLSAGRYSVVISDEKMPNGRGVDFLADCAREFPSTVRILLTGYADPQIAAEAVNRGEIFRLLFKPWNDLELVATIRQAAWRAALIAEEEGAVVEYHGATPPQGAPPEAIGETGPELTSDAYPPVWPRA